MEASPAHTCRICRRRAAQLTFEHVPPRRAFNNERTRVYGLEGWLQRDDEGLTGGRIEQRGAGDYTLCAECNNNTGSWYAAELTGWVYAAVDVMSNLPPIAEVDRETEPHVAGMRFRQVRPLAFIK